MSEDQDNKFYKFEWSSNYVKDFFIGTAEKTVKQSALDPDSFDNPFNPDDLYRKAGDYTIYEEMLKDDQVFAASQLKKDMVLGSGWDIAIQDEGQEDIRDFLIGALSQDMCRPFEEQLEEIISAYDFGFSLSEKLFKKREDGHIVFNEFKTRHPNTWLIQQAVNGSVEKFIQRGSSNEIILDPKQLLHYVNQPKFQNPYGNSDLRPAYQAYFVKRHVIRFYSIFLEKAASPTPVAMFDKNAPQSAIDKIFNAIKKLQAKTALVVPKDIELKFLESTSNGEAYINGINLFNTFIGRSLLIPDLLGFTGSQVSGGSFALGKEHMRIFFKHISRRRKILEAYINNEIIRPMIIANFGVLENNPKWKLGDVSQEDVMDFAKLWVDAVKGNIFSPNDEEINHLRSIVNFPEGDVERKADPAPIPGFAPENGPLDDGNGGVEPEEDVEEEESPTDQLADDLDRMSKFQAKTRPFLKTDGDFSNKVDFDKIESLMDNTVDTIVSASQPITDEIVEDLINQIEKKKILEKKNIAALGDLKVKGKSKLQRVLNKGLEESFKKSQLIAAQELSSTDTKREFAEPLLDSEFAAFIEGENFEAIADYEFALTKKARIEAVKAIKDGTSLANLKGVLTDEGNKLSKIAMERYARTKSTEVINRARVNFFKDSGIISGYQYSAIIDGRTTEICAGLHGKIFKAGAEPVPPLHFNALVEGSMIKTMSGNKPIEKVEIGELVQTHTGAWNKVYDTMNKFEDKEYYDIELDNGLRIQITGEHPVLTDRGWIRTDELKLSDNIICLEDIGEAIHVA